MGAVVDATTTLLLVSEVWRVKGSLLHVFTWPSEEALKRDLAWRVRAEMGEVWALTVARRWWWVVVCGGWWWFCGGVREGTEGRLGWEEREDDSE